MSTAKPTVLQTVLSFSSLYINLQGWTVLIRVHVFPKGIAQESQIQLFLVSLYSLLKKILRRTNASL